jgi:uncharacterized protein with NAD-binding domain and iron-sulfur cluster
MAANGKAKTRVAVLGAGCGSMAAVWGLLNSDRADEYEITVYQYGWRIGGKGASGRNAAYGQRIEEHGLHIWGGCYENAFQIMRDVYGSLARNPSFPLSTWYDPESQKVSAFWPHGYVSLSEFLDQRWGYWDVELPMNRDLPGDGQLLPSLSAYLADAIGLLVEAMIGADLFEEIESALGPLVNCLGPAKHVVHAVERLVEPLPSPREIARAEFQSKVGLDAHHRIRAAANALPNDPALHTQAHYEAILHPLRDLLLHFFDSFAHLFDDHPDLRHLYELLDFGIALVSGVIDDGVLVHGFDVVDGIELDDWLRTNGASEYTVEGAIVRGWHDFFFANRKGDPAQPSMSAASALRTIVRYVLTYKGAFFWKMQAGMGDTIFAPLYEHARARGVKFEHFHRVERVSNVDATGAATDRVQSIEVARQVSLRKGLTQYEPLIDVLKVPSWPSEPRWDQLDPEQAKELQRRDVDLESIWADWEPVERRTLRLGVDFDQVILGISVAALPAITGDLMAASQSFAKVVRGSSTNQTLAMQLWLKPTLKELGWDHPSTVGTVHAEPHTTWSNMDQLLDKEDWSDVADPPKCVVYWCGTFRDAPVIPPPSDHAFPSTQDALVKGASLAWLMSNARSLFPKAAAPHTSPGLDWSKLTIKHPTQGEGAFDQQFWRANIDPSERYVLSLPGSASVRIRADESGFTNLWLAGDWLYTGFNAGCVEAAVMGGLQASRAMSGFPARIIGDDEGGFERRK